MGDGGIWESRELSFSSQMLVFVSMLPARVKASAGVGMVQTPRLQACRAVTFALIDRTMPLPCSEASISGKAPLFHARWSPVSDIDAATAHASCNVMIRLSPPPRAQCCPPRNVQSSVPPSRWRHWEAAGGLSRVPKQIDLYWGGDFGAVAGPW